VTPPFGKCVWCERTDFTEEHIIGRQFAKAVEISYPAPFFAGRFELPEHQGIVLNDRVCDTCNRNWMRKLDNKAMAAIGAALGPHETRIHLKEAQQRWVSMWATKVALLLQLQTIDLQARHPELAEIGDKAWVPDESFVAIEKDKRRPPDGTKVWIGALDSAHPLKANYRERVGSFDAWEKTPSGLMLPQRRGYLVLFNLRRFVVYVNGFVATPDPPDLTPLVGRKALRRIWPISERVAEWPPPQALGEGDLNQLTSSEAQITPPPEGWRRLVGPPKAPKAQG
jgi:hypothetical protein